MILRRDAMRRGQGEAAETRAHGPRDWLYLSDGGGLTQFGAYVETLGPRAQGSDRHWHEKEDELVFVLSGELTVVEDDGEHVLHPGDAACWPAGIPNAHTLLNRSDSPASYLVLGTRATHDVCHYPDQGTALHTEGERWWVQDKAGTVLRAGPCKSPPGRD